ncbi:MAG: phytanoyl-CoA dioxygenase family protein [Verrucomicrobia subdivision 3 bacterium]|nr:phytanoyl-CoA dioxygenase family protein [Limisphaerales bacterium]
MSAPLTDEQLAAFVRDGFLVLPNFYERGEVEAVQRGVHSIIGLLIEQHQLAIEQTDFASETFDAGYQSLIAHDRALGGVVYDAVKQIPAFIRLVASAKHEAVVRQVRGTDAPGIAAGGYGIRIDNPAEEKFRAGWHQDYPAQLRSLDGLVFWSPLLAMTDELGPVEFCIGSHKDDFAPVCEHDSANPDKTGAYGLTLADEAERVAKYEKSAPLTEPCDLVLVDFLTLHRSGENRAARSRWSMQMRWFNFAEPTGKKLGWPGAYAAGNDLRAVHPEWVVE